MHHPPSNPHHSHHHHPACPSSPSFLLALLSLSLSRHAARQELKPPLCVGSEGVVESGGGGSANNNAEQSCIQSGQVLAVMPPPTQVSAPCPLRNRAAAPTVWSLRRRLCFILSTHLVTHYEPRPLHSVHVFFVAVSAAIFLPQTTQS